MIGRKMKKNTESFTTLPDRKILVNCNFFFAFREINRKKKIENKQKKKQDL